MDNIYDIIVIGAGHAGCEAAVASARLGSKVLLVTMDMNKIAQMSCNPAIGGIAKGQIVREIDALGGFTGIVTDASTIQFRMLNRSKGPAMWSPRAQCDKLYYSLNWRYILENTCNLDIWQDSATSISFLESNIFGVHVSMGAIFKCKAVILTAGTFLNGKLFIGNEMAEGGRIGELSSYGLTELLKSKGCTTARMKTGTPPRIDVRSLDLNSLVLQEGDDVPSRFSYLPIPSPIQSGVAQKNCYIVHTNKEVHDILRTGFDRSPLFTGKIHGIGPRYCPSIEDKLRTFAGKDAHQLFLEPEGWDTYEYYLQGFSSSLPLTVQLEALRAIKGFENVKIFRPAYAVEYDYFDPTLLYPSLESRVIPNFFFAGQVNGTTGYEEAAAQGLMAGINAHLKINEKEPFVLSRDKAYIGVLIDDLINKGVDEPYRMFTSRAEYRILLRQDNADFRLTEPGHSLGLVDEYRYQYTMRKYDLTNDIISFSNSTSVKPEEINTYLSSINSAPISSKKKLSDILTRPDVSISELLKNVPRETSFIFQDDFDDKINNVLENGMVSTNTSAVLIALPWSAMKFNGIVGANDYLKNEIIESAEIQIKYQGYIEREKRIADKILRLESLTIPDNFDFSKVTSLSIECRIKLNRYKPQTIAQASRISGVSPADISVLLIYFGR
ncbi:MAG: tRNA uridine-5-carboxymethylaminomethyl(34) synthesis enzyme MnmG [Bacteroidales bacterium]|nr:tRNA uridine-5-carboxymethylaminomethyl(34) synthesis enzyme MnmG [Bacteroidales bacterium]MDD4670726.1 tRNA uridine-5-carboxymethylaminomethyl(34) synthesis enzyme MnmG [Bacteroidales bacterium]